MKVSHRLYLSVLPAVLGVLTVAGLSYWGQYAHAIPEVPLAIAVVAAVGSLALSWMNARQMVQRVEGVVDSLSSAVAGAEAAKTEGERAADKRVAEYASLVEAVASASAERLEEVRLPLHILLENHFGDLNENQEEMLGAARSAAESIDMDIMTLQQIAALDLGRRELRNDRILLGDLLRALVPTLQAAAEQARATLRVDIEPGLPAIHGDPPLLHDSLATVLGDAIKTASPGTDLSLSLSRVSAATTVRLDGASPQKRTPRSIFAERVLTASGAQLTRGDVGVEVAFTAR